MARRKPLFDHPEALERLPAGDRVHLNILNVGPKGPDLAINTANKSVTITHGVHSVFSNSSTSANRQVDFIFGGVDGDILILRGHATSLAINYRDGNGNLRLASSFSIDQLYDTLVLYFDGTNWLELVRSNNGN